MKLIYPCEHDSNCYPDIDRNYLAPFFGNQTCLLLTDNTISHVSDIHELVKSAGSFDCIVIDITHNPVGMKQTMFQGCCRGEIIRNIEELVGYCNQYAPTRVLHCDFNYVATTPNYFYFPLWLWMWSARLPLWYEKEILHNFNNNASTLYDTVENKVLGMLCMNRTPSWHRILFYNAVVEKSWLTKISYTFGNHGYGKQYQDAYYFLTKQEIAEFESKKHHLPFTLIDKDQKDTTDVGVGHPAWGTHTFNLVTESTMDNTLLSEKTAKPFITKMIPVILGPRNTAKHLQEAGLDMFGDVVPWHTWDHLPDPRDRIKAVVEWLEEFLTQDLVAIYHANKHRVDRNKEFFHSQQFRDNITAEMLKLSSS